MSGLPSLERYLRTRTQVVTLIVSSVAIYAVIVVALFALAVQTERTRAQSSLDSETDELMQVFRSRLNSLESDLALLGAKSKSASFGSLPTTEAINRLLLSASETVRLERRNSSFEMSAAYNSTARDPGTLAARQQLNDSAMLACKGAQQLDAAQFSQSFFVPTQSGLGFENLDLCATFGSGEQREFWLLSISLSELIKLANETAAMRHGEVYINDTDGARLATLALGLRGKPQAASSQLMALPGAAFLIGVTSRSTPGLPLLSSFALIAGLFSLLLFASVLLLARDVLRRQRAENALSTALSLRQAMENSLVTGLRARDLTGCITYVNPAFCEITGRDADTLVGATPPMPYWPPEALPEHEQRLARRMAGVLSREVFETEFLRPDGSRVPVLVFEAPLLDGSGVHTGWMASVLDISEQRKVEALARAQQDKLADTSRLMTVGELASTLSHELNQPLAAIASLAAAARNLAAQHAPPAIMDEILQDLGAQAERAGRVIRSVHGFVKRGDRKRELLDLRIMLGDLAPLLQLQARAHQARFEVVADTGVSWVSAERTLLEQVILNLTRNGFEAMRNTPREERLLSIGLSQGQSEHGAPCTLLRILDRGHGIGDAGQLFTPFYTTKPQGMGLGLSICRTVIEQYGGSLKFAARPGGGAQFEFRLPLPTDEPLN